MGHVVTKECHDKSLGEYGKKNVKFHRQIV